MFKIAISHVSGTESNLQTSLTG